MAFVPIFSITLAAVAAVTILLFRCQRSVRRFGNNLAAFCLSARPERLVSFRLSSDWRSTFQPPTFLTATLSGLLLLCLHVTAVTVHLTEPLRHAIETRAAQAAVISLPLLLISSSRKNAFASLAGVSHLDVSFLHVCLGYLIAIEIAIHVALHISRKYHSSQTVIGSHGANSLLFLAHKIGWFAYLVRPGGVASSKHR